jgi:CheY-like chemotaxis protein
MPRALAQAFGTTATLALVNAPGGGCIATLDCPFEPEKPPHEPHCPDRRRRRSAARTTARRAAPGLARGCDIVAECANGVDAWDAFLEHEPQVALLDIRMPGLTGIEVARRIDGRAPVVFVTAFGDHALAAFDAGAVDYVMKPVDPERLGQAREGAAGVPAAQPAHAGARGPAGPAGATGRTGAGARRWT